MVTIKAKRNQLVTSPESKLGFYEDNSALMKKIQSNLYAIHKRLDSLETVNIKLEDMLINNYNALDKIEERLKQIENKLETKTISTNFVKRQKPLPSMSPAQFTGTNPH